MQDVAAQPIVVEIPDEVEEQRRRVGQAVDAVEHAAVARQDACRILDAEVALDGRDGHVADEAAERRAAAPAAIWP